MKNIFFAIACLICFKAIGQNATTDFDGKKWEAPYQLDIPTGWDVERFLIPISFAPAIPYHGVEDIRFTPGWGKIETNEYWSYAFLWYLDDKATIDPAIIEKNLTAYYTGLININTDKTKTATSKLPPVKATIKTRSAEKGDLETFEGTVSMLDYMSRKPIILNLIIHIKNCAAQNKTFVFHEVSPRPYNESVWNSLHQLWTNFKCIKE